MRPCRHEASWNLEGDMATETTIDVRGMVPRERHPRIFATFDSIAGGDAILLINDHDPKPLFYQFQAERPGQINWTPREQGPERWVIRIEKVAGSDAVHRINPTHLESEPEHRLIPLEEVTAAGAGQEGAVLVDVREDIRAGREPFGRIMEALGSLRDGQELRLINSFEPVPLYDVMAERGFAHQAERLPDGDWHVRFFRT
jgi:uncharacterized protein (DUF2249 family)